MAKSKHVVRRYVGLIALLAYCSAATASAQSAPEEAIRLRSSVGASVEINQVTEDSFVRAPSADQTALIDQTGGGLDGLFALNQDVGAMNSQANVVVGAVADEGGYARASISERQALRRNTLERAGGGESLIMRDSFDGGSGIIQINQAAGAFNQQVNALAFAMGLERVDDLAGMSDVELSRVRDTNTLLQEGAPGARTIEAVGNFDGFTGIVQVNQTVGAFNQVSNTIALNTAGGGL